MIRIISPLCIACPVLIFVLGFWSPSCAGDIAEGQTQVPKKEIFAVEFNKGLLSVDVKDANVTEIFKELEKKGKIEIINQGILPDKKVSIKFRGLKIREGIKELIRVSGICNYIVLYKRDMISRLILLKPRLSDVKIEETDVKETYIAEDETDDVLDRDIDRAQRETIIKAIEPLLESETDEETARKIRNEIMTGQTEAFDD
jgi:hypothetical protein